MTQFISKNKKWFGYPLYIILLTLVLLYYRFPEDVLRDYIQSKANGMNSRLLLSIERVQPWPTFGLKFVKTKLSLKDKPDSTLLKADDVIVRPNLLSLFQRKKVFSFDGIAYEGDLKGSVSLVKGNRSGSLSTELKLKDVNLGGDTSLKELVGRSVKGILSGTIRYNGAYNPMHGGKGEAKLTLVTGQVELVQPFLSLKSINFNEMSIEMILNKNLINLAGLELKGREMNGTLSGRITLRKDFFKSDIFLKGKIKLFPGSFSDSKGFRNAMKLIAKRLRDGTLSITIRGTIEKPRIRFT